MQTKVHSFSIPVMGIGFTIDSAIKVAPFGISSVMSLVDDKLIERMREFHSRAFKLPFTPISEKANDSRAKRITEYLNTVDEIVKSKLEKLKSSIHEKGKALDQYIDMLPDYSEIKQEFTKLIEAKTPLKNIKAWVEENLQAGSIDVNIMTKLDKQNYQKGEVLPMEYNDAFAGLRGYANSQLRSSIVFSAGMHPRLYSYMEQFDDFYPDAQGRIKKKIIVKVSDLRSAQVQGLFFAKKGLWVSEYRIESGLNCGGHAFATDGLLLGPILQAFKDSKKELTQQMHEAFCTALETKNKPIPSDILDCRISVQGGVGTAQEHRFLLEHYQVDSVAWGSPFLLVNEATSLDQESVDLLAKAEEKDLYLSDISPLGVKFNSVRGNTKDLEKALLIQQNKPGSNCPKRYLVSNTEFTEKAICTASRQYQKNKINEIKAQELSPKAYQEAYNKIVEKSCICVGLGTSSLLEKQLDTKIEGSGVSICPGPNIAYFKRAVSLENMVGHIYGKQNVAEIENRPHLFVKEANMYVEHFKETLLNIKEKCSRAELKKLKAYRENMENGFTYYKNLFSEIKTDFQDTKYKIFNDICALEKEFHQLYDLLTKKVSISS